VVRHDRVQNTDRRDRSDQQQLGTNAHFLPPC
jgi:hypothetical protein